MRFLILSTGEPSKYLVEAIKAQGHVYEYYNPHHVYLYISDKEGGYDRIFDGSPTIEKPKRLYARNYDAIITRIGNELIQSLAVLRHLNENLGIYSPQTSMGLLIAHDKFWTCQALSRYGVKTPPSMLAIRPTHSDFAVDMIGLPVVIKQLTGSQGSGVSILESKLSVKTTLESFYKAKVPVKLQRFIKAVSGRSGDVTDIRAIVVGNEVVSAMERGTTGDDFRANLSRGGRGVRTILDKQETKLCVDAAKALGLEFAGVDLIQEKTKPDGKRGGCFVTEVNGNPGTGIIDITGYNYFTDLVKYIVSRKQAMARAAASADTQDSDNQASALSSYPADMLHAGMNSQQILDACAGLILNDASPEKLVRMDSLGSELLDNFGASEPDPVIDNITRIELEMNLDARFGASVNHRISANVTPTPAKTANKLGHSLSEASAQALADFRRMTGL